MQRRHALCTVLGAARIDIEGQLSIAIGFGISSFLDWTPSTNITWLQWKPIVVVSISRLDILLVACGAIVCCCLGAIPPAWKASQLDPFDAIVEGRFH